MSPCRHRGCSRHTRSLRKSQSVWEMKRGCCIAATPHPRRLQVRPGEVSWGYYRSRLARYPRGHSSACRYQRKLPLRRYTLLLPPCPLPLTADRECTISKGRAVEVRKSGYAAALIGRSRPRRRASSSSHLWLQSESGLAGQVKAGKRVGQPAAAGRGRLRGRVLWAVGQ